MKVVILCGGKGTRLREKTEFMPKPLIRVGGMPILWHIMKHYSHHGYKDFILCLGYKGNMIKEYFKDNNENWNIEFVDTGEDSTKAERLMKIKDYINTEKFLAAYGDDISDININETVNFHLKHGKMVTLTAIPLYSNFGILEMNDNNEIIKFKEKPRLHGHWFNGGFFVFNKKIFDYLNKGDLEKEVFEFLSKENQIIGFKHKGFWKFMNTFKDWQELNELWKENKAKWKIWD